MKSMLRKGPPAPHFRPDEWVTDIKVMMEVDWVFPAENLVEVMGVPEQGSTPAEKE